jgi:hypothetical protein
VALVTAKAVTTESSGTQPAREIPSGDALICGEGSRVGRSDANPFRLSPLNRQATYLRLEALRI